MNDSARRDKPLYQTIFETLRQRIGADEWPLGGPFPSEAELSAAFSASRITVRHALRLLEEEGYIRKAAARRTLLVATTPRQSSPWIVRSIDDIIAQVGDARLRVVSWRMENSPGDAESLGLPPRTRLYCLRSVLERAGRPIIRSVIYFPPDIGEQLTQEMFNDVIVFRVLGRELGIFLEDVRITVWPELADHTDAAQLKCPAGAPLLITQLLYHAEGGRAVEVAYSRRFGPEARFSTTVTNRPTTS